MQCEQWTKLILDEWVGQKVDVQLFGTKILPYQYYQLTQSHRDYV